MSANRRVWVTADRDGKRMIMEWEKDDLREFMMILQLEDLLKLRIVGDDWFPVDRKLYPAKLVEPLKNYHEKMKRRAWRKNRN